MRDDVRQRAARHAALGDPVRLAIVDDLVASDRSPRELQHRHGLASNLLAHHLDVLEEVGMISRGRSSGDGRRRYVHLHPKVDAFERPTILLRAPVLFICTANSARSQLAAALWTVVVGRPAASAGTHPADRVHPGAVDAARRAGLDLTHSRTRRLEHAPSTGLVITVCDRAHEELAIHDDWWHWSIRDPVPVGSKVAFDATVAELRSRIEAVAA